MNASQRFDSDFADLLAELAQPQSPDYFDEALQRALAHRQRPAWTFPERWLPMGVLTRRLPLVPALPSRTIGLLLMLLLLLLATVVIGVGAMLWQQRPAPQFGIAANGVIAYSQDGDIYTLDPVTGESRIIVGGPTVDVEPWFTRDGTGVVFVRMLQTGPDEVIEGMMADASGANPRTLLGPVPGEELRWVELSPDGRLLAVATNDTAQLSVLDISTGAQTSLDLPVAVEMHGWLPPGDEIVLLGRPSQSTSPLGLYAVRPDGSGFRTIVEPDGSELQPFSVSGDGRYIAYNTFTQLGGEWHLVDLATGADSAQSAPDGEWNLDPVFSPDSSRVAFTRYNNQRLPRIDAQVFIASVDDPTSVVAVGPMMSARAGGGGLTAHFSPDGTKLFITSNDLLDASDEGDAWLVDLVSGTYESVSLGTVDGFSWQRLAP